MPKKKGNASSASIRGAGTDSPNVENLAPQNTFTAASGKFYATACDNYPEAEDFSEDFTCDVVGAAEGDLLEVLAMHEDWAYGCRFKPRQDYKLEGVFRLEWVVGMKLVLENGKRKPVEIDIRSEEYGFKPHTKGLQAKRYRKRIDEAAEIWNRLEAKAVADDIAHQELTAAKVAKNLEKEDAEAHERKKKEEERRETILAEVRRRKAEAEFAKKQEVAEAERIRIAQEVEERAKRQEQIAKFRIEQQAEEERCRAILEEQARLNAEQAENRRLEQEANERRAVAEAEQARLDAEQAENRRLEQEAEERRALAEAEVKRVADAKALTLEFEDSVGHHIECRSQREALLDTPSTCHDNQSTSDASCGVDHSSDCSNQKRRTGLQKKNISRKLRRPSSELDAVTDEWEKVQEDMANKSSDLDTLEEKVNSLLQSQGAGDCLHIGPPPGLELMSKAELYAAEVSVLKQRVFQAMIKTKRLAGFEQKTSVVLKKKVFQAMFSAKRSLSPSSDKESEMKALQLKNLMKRAFRGMRDSKSFPNGNVTPRSSKSPESPGGLLSPEGKDLEMLAEQVVEQLQTKAESIKAQIRNGFLRAHRTGELLELRHELDELADSVSQIGVKLGSGTGLNSPCPNSPETCRKSLLEVNKTPMKKRWSEYTSGESESDIGVTGRSPPQLLGDCSDSDRETKRDRRWGSSGARACADLLSSRN